MTSSGEKEKYRAIEDSIYLFWRQAQENKCIKTCIKLYRYLNKAVTF